MFGASKLVVLFSVLISITAQGRQNLYIHQPYISTRVMGMGGAFAAVADDYNTLYYNPAGLARLQEGQLNMGIQAGATPSIINFSNDLKNAGSDVAAIQTVLANNMGAHLSSRVSLGGTWVRPGWGVGFYPLDLTVEADVRSSAGPTVGAMAYQDSTFQFGLAFKIFGPEKVEPKKLEEEPAKPEEEAKPAEEKPEAAAVAPVKELTEEEKKKQEVAKKADEERKKKELEARKDAAEKAANLANIENNKQEFLSVGVAPKIVYRAFGDKDLTLFDLQQSSNLFRPEDVQEGMTVDTDLGALYQMRVYDGGFLGFTRYFRPTFAVVIRNLIDAGFTSNFHLYHKQSTTNTEKLGRRFDLGAKFDLPSFWVFYPRIALDIRDLGARYISPKKSFHFGVELLWKAFSWLHGGYRVGFSQGYFTAGVSADLAIFMLDLATYAEEIGSSENPRESRRYMLKASLDF